MKKILMGMMVVGASLAMASDIVGVIQSIDSAKKTITVNGMVIGVMPHTKIEQDHCGMGWDQPRRFADLKQGDFVDVDLIDHMPMQNGIPMAEDIEIQCANRAY